MPRISKVQRLRDQGFDKSSHIPGTKSHYIRCSQCEASAINGVPCHERGCPNAAEAARQEREEAMRDE